VQPAELGWLRCLVLALSLIQLQTEQCPQEETDAGGDHNGQYDERKLIGIHDSRPSASIAEEWPQTWR
jgi:hypothetical protein